MLLNFALNFGQYVQLITIDWTDQTDTMAHTNVALKLKIIKYWMFSICFRPDQDLLTDMGKNEYSFFPCQTQDQGSWVN